MLALTLESRKLRRPPVAASASMICVQMSHGQGYQVKDQGHIGDNKLLTKK